MLLAFHHQPQGILPRPQLQILHMQRNHCCCHNCYCCHCWVLLFFFGWFQHLFSLSPSPTLFLAFLVVISASAPSLLEFLLFRLLFSISLVFPSTLTIFSHSHGLDFVIHSNCNFTITSICNILPSKRHLLCLQVAPSIPTQTIFHSMSIYDLLILPPFHSFTLIMLFYLHSA